MKFLFNYEFRNDVMPLSCIHVGILEQCRKTAFIKRWHWRSKARCLDFIVRAIEEVAIGFAENAALFRAMTGISPTQVLKEQVLTPLASRFKIITLEMLWIRKIASIEADYNSRRKQRTSIKIWSHLEQYKDAAGMERFSNLAPLGLALYALSISNAKVERIFSKMNCFRN